MPFNGSGQFVPLSFPIFPAQTGTLIKASDFNANLNDLFAGLSNCMTRDGQSTATANIPMGGFTFTGLAIPASNGQPLVYGSNASIANLEVTGSAHLKGGVTLGDAASDTLSINSTTVAWTNGTVHLNNQTFRGPVISVEPASPIASIIHRVKNPGTGLGVFAAYQLQTASLTWEVGTEGNGRFYVNNGTRDCISLPSTGEVRLYKPNSNEAAVNPTDLMRKQEFDAATALLNLILPIGSILPIADLAAPAGWLLVDGKTIGSAASGATARANADTQALFAKLWAFSAAAVPIFDSAGAATTRGADAAADFAANKRLPLFTPDGGYFLRMWTPGQTINSGRVAGTSEAHRLVSHGHEVFSDNSGSGPSGDPTSMNGGNFGVGGTARSAGYLVNNGNGVPIVQATGGAENCPYNLAMPHYIRYA